MVSPFDFAGTDRFVLVLLGKKDNVVGDLEKAAANAQHFPDIQIEVLDSGHLIGVEHADTVNKRINEFLFSE